MATNPTDNPKERLDVLARDYWEALLQQNPRLATFIGDSRFDDRLEDAGPEGREASADLHRQVQERLNSIDRAALSVDDQVTWDMLRLAAEERLEELDLRMDQFWVDQMDGPQVWLPDLLNWHKTDTPKGVDNLIARYQAFPRYIEQYLANLSEGVASGRTGFRVVVERVIGQIRALIETPASDSPLSQVGVASAKPAVAETVQDSVYPAFRGMLESLEGAYLEQDARRDPGLWAIARGDRAYAFLCRKHTTTTLTPREIHDYGTQDLAAIHAEMRRLMSELGETGELSAFARRLFDDRAYWETDPARIVALAERSVSHAQEVLPSMLGRLPATPCVVKAVEDFRERDAPSAFYYPPSADGSRPGVFYVNCFLQAMQPAWELPGIAFHEAVPGHHVQIAIAQERTDLPDFRRLGTDMTAYVEGWALYTERLADEFKLYQSAHERLAMLINQAWRACRLVIDTGLHEFHWTREQAISFLRDNAFLSEQNAANEVDRYIVIPGQALSYKIGQREIEAARADATAALGPRFDLKGFHDEVLRYGPIPLSTLRQVVRSWVAEASPQPNA